MFEPSQPAVDPTKIDREFLRKLNQLCHPDRHGQSPLSVAVFQRLQEIGQELDKREKPAQNAASTPQRRTA